jgi:hypothetical protein
LCKYTRVRAAAYNRQGIGPFSEPVLIRVSPDQLMFMPTQGTTQGTAAGTTLSTNFVDDPNVISPELAPGLDLVLQELWFVVVASLVCVVLLVAVVAVICLRRKRKAIRMMGKNMAGHYNGKICKRPFFFSDTRGFIMKYPTGGLKKLFNYSIPSPIFDLCIFSV